MGFFDDVSSGLSGFGKRGLQALGRIPTDEEMALRNRALDLQERDLNSILDARSLDLKTKKAELAGLNDFAVGHGFNFGQMQQMLGAAGSVRTLAEANLANQQAQSVASARKAAEVPLLDRMDEAISAAMGHEPGFYKQMVLSQQAMANFQGAQVAEVQQQIDGILDPLEAAARQAAGRDDLELFTNQDRKDGLALLQDRISKGASQDEALNAVLQAAARRAKSRFFELTYEPQGPPAPEGVMAQPAGRMAGIGQMATGLLGIENIPTNEITRTPFGRSIEGLK